MEDLYAQPKRSVANQVMDYALPAMSILEAIITGTASKGKYIGTTGLDVMSARETQERAREAARQKAIERQVQSQKDLAEAADRTRKSGFEAAKAKRDAATWEQTDKEAQEKANTRKATIDRLIGIPNEYDEKTNTVTRSGVPGVPDLTPEDKAAIQADPISWLTNRLKPQPTQLVIGGDGTYQPVNKLTGKNPEGKTVTAPPKPTGTGPQRPPAGYRWREDGTLEPIPGGPAGAPKPLSGDAAKLSGYVSTLQTQGQVLKNLIQDNGIRWVTMEYKKGNPAVVNVIEDAADAKGRLRSGGAVNDQEAERFKQPFTGLGNVFYADNKAALKAIDQVLAEADRVQAGMGGQTAPSVTKPGSTVPGRSSSLSAAIDKSVAGINDPAEDPRKAMAQQALNDPEATPEEKAAARRILGIR
jgi:hypothetical protein